MISTYGLTIGASQKRLSISADLQLRRSDPHSKLNFDQMAEEFTIRLATIDDVETIATHRARMFDEMGDVYPGTFETLRAKSRDQLREFFSRGEYIGWLAISVERPDFVVGGAGVQLRQVLPHPIYQGENKDGVAEGRHAIIINVFTEPEWRRRGIAKVLMQRIIEWARAKELDSLVLHASDAGRALYERLGFVRTNEMRLTWGQS